MLRLFHRDVPLTREWLCARCNTVALTPAYRYSGCTCQERLCQYCAKNRIMAASNEELRLRFAGEPSSVPQSCAYCKSTSGEYTVDPEKTQAATDSHRQQAAQTLFGLLRTMGAYGGHLDEAIQQGALKDVVTLPSSDDGEKTPYYLLSLDDLEAKVAGCGWQPSRDPVYHRLGDARLFVTAYDKGASGDAWIVFADGTMYRGAIQSDQPHGKGTRYTSFDTIAYTGGWENGEFSGIGTEYCANRPKYEEEHSVEATFSATRSIDNPWSQYSIVSGDDRQHGNHCWYTGTFKNGKYDGDGVLTEPDGTTKKGQFKNGLLDGVGEYYDGWHRDRYKGEFRAGKLDGQGSIEFSTGLRYEGGFRAGKRHGVNASYNSDGFCHYRGEFVDGVQEGQGTHYYKDGSWFEGVWWQNNLLKRSPGFFFPDGTAHEGSWVNFVATSGVHRYLNGDVYNGRFRGASRSGTGTCEYANDDVYDGEWKYDKPHGNGLWRFSKEGDYYRGDWYNGRYDGRGVYGWSDGCRFEASWRNGLPTAAGVLSPKRLCTEHAKTCTSKTFLQPPTDGD